MWSNLLLLAGDGLSVRQLMLIYAWVARALLLSFVTHDLPVVCGGMRATRVCTLGVLSKRSREVIADCV